MNKPSKLLALAAAVALSAGTAYAQDPTFFRIGTGSAGGTYFPIGGTIANGISAPPGARPCDKGGTCGCQSASPALAIPIALALALVARRRFDDEA